MPHSTRPDQGPAQTTRAEIAAWVFTQTPADDRGLSPEPPFTALNAARRALQRAGFAIGHMQSGEPIGLLHGGFAIQKWRNLSPAHRAQLHGTLEGDFRHGPVRLSLTARCPAHAAEDLAEQIAAMMSRDAALAQAEG